MKLSQPNLRQALPYRGGEGGGGFLGDVVAAAGQHLVAEGSAEVLRYPGFILHRSVVVNPSRTVG